MACFAGFCVVSLRNQVSVATQSRHACACSTGWVVRSAFYMWFDGTRRGNQSRSFCNRFLSPNKSDAHFDEIKDESRSLLMYSVTIDAVDQALMLGFQAVFLGFLLYRNDEREASHASWAAKI